MEIEIDFASPLESGKEFVVYVDTAEDAEIFIRLYKEKFPGKATTWSPSRTHFGEYSRLCYRPCLNGDGGLRYGDYRYYEARGFTIIPFCDIIVQNDIDESDISIDQLFGGSI